MSTNITLVEYVNNLLMDLERARITGDPVIINAAQTKFDLGQTALQLASVVVQKQTLVDQANMAAGTANSRAKTAKTAFDTAVAVYNANQTTQNRDARDAASAAYDTALGLAVDAAAHAATLSNQLNAAINQANAAALQIGYTYPIALPSDQEILETLTQLITDGCIDVSEIQQKITEIVTTSNTFTAFIEKMAVFNDYEAILEVRLRQIFNFLSEDGIIDAQEAIITTLRHEIINAINIYKTSVVNNNSLATQVNKLYIDVEDRLNNLHLISSEVSHTMSDVEKLILLKRGGQTFAKKVVFVPIAPNTYSPGTTLSMITTNMTLISGTTFQMRYNFVYDSLAKTIKWMGSPGSPANEIIYIDVELEAMSTSHNAYDTTSTCTINLRTIGGIERVKDISCVQSSGRLALNKGEVMTIKFKESPTIPLRINQGMITICLS